MYEELKAFVLNGALDGLLKKANKGGAGLKKHVLSCTALL
jgi:hypothetical protein